MATKDDSGRDVGTSRDAFEVVAESRNAWKQFMIETGAAKSEELYETWWGSRVRSGTSV